MDIIKPISPLKGTCTARLLCCVDIAVSFRLVSCQIADAAINLIILSAFLVSPCNFNASQLKFI